MALPPDAPAIAAVYEKLGLPQVNWGATATTVKATVPASQSSSGPAGFPVETSFKLGSCQFAVKYIGGSSGLTDVQLRHQAKGDDQCFDTIVTAMQSALVPASTIV
jgi:hypothetical protein